MFWTLFIPSGTKRSQNSLQMAEHSAWIQRFWVENPWSETSFVTKSYFLRTSIHQLEMNAAAWAFWMSTSQIKENVYLCCACCQNGNVHEAQVWVVIAAAGVIGGPHWNLLGLSAPRPSGRLAGRTLSARSVYQVKDSKNSKDSKTFIWQRKYMLLDNNP